MSCNGCCGDSTGNGEQNTVVVSTCCGQPDPGQDGTDFTAILSVADATTPGQELNLYPMGVAGSLAVPTISQRLYIFSYQVLVSVSGFFKLYEGVAGDSTNPGEFATVCSGTLAQHGGMIHRMPNRYLRLGNVLHASHSAVGQVDVVVHGKLVTES